MGHPATTIPVAGLVVRCLSSAPKFPIFSRWTGSSRVHEVFDVMHTTDHSIQATPTVRVVFDGPPFAGKTTAAHALSDALGGTVVTPDEQDGRTLWFDWMTYDAGHHAGQPVRVELVTVPGQHDLADRRRHLLAWGDVIVFVANTSRAVFNDSVRSFRELRAELAWRPETPVVVMANKRDLIDAVSMDEVRAQLELSPHDTVLESIALQGGGIREAFVHAVHAALGDPNGRFEPTSADALLHELQAAVAPPEPAAVPMLAETEPVPQPLPAGLCVELQRPELNPDGIADGDAIVILAEHWRVLVEVANGAAPLPRTTDPAEAVVVAELAAWGLVVEGDTTHADTQSGFAAMEPVGATVRF